ncbi:MAG TPA: ferredoxin [Acidimicrobiia bacterium]|nr:ferredoxin [Acidimicrobiia bacterium]
MRATINEDYCVGSGLCEMICPEVFEVRDVSHVKIDPIPPEHEEAVRRAAASCPTEAIELAP